MKTASIPGIVLIVLGIIGLAYGGIHYKTRQRVFDAGPLHATREKHETIPIPPVLGGISLVGGIILVVVGAKQQ